MFDVTHIEDYKTVLQEWLYQVQNKVQSECKGLKQYKETEDAIEQLVAALQENSFSDAQIDDIYCSISDYQSLASSVAYIIGLRDGLAARNLIENIPVKDIIENSL